MTNDADATVLPVYEGRAWVFGDNMDTDLMLPGSHLWASVEERARVVFSANRPGWVDQVVPGDTIVAGKNFGIGSSRPAALSLRTLGISLVLAESINSLFLRTSINFGLPAFECPGITGLVNEGGIVRMDLNTWQAHNASTGGSLPVKRIPDVPLRIMLAGGVINLLESQGLIASRPASSGAAA